MLPAVASSAMRAAWCTGVATLASRPQSSFNIGFFKSDGISRYALWGRHWFSSAGSSTTDRHTVEGRYGHALLAAAQTAKALDQVHADVQELQEALQSSSDFVAFAKSPGVSAETKIAVVQQMADRFRFHTVTRNFLCTIAENKRMADLPKMLSSFEELYRATRGEVRCFVTSAQELTVGQKKEVVAALQKRAGPKAIILADFHTSPSVAGGLHVRMGDEVLDYTIATRVENLRTQLMAPLNA